MGGNLRVLGNVGRDAAHPVSRTAGVPGQAIPAQRRPPGLSGSRRGNTMIAENKSDTSRYLANWQDEVDSAALYQAIAAAESNPQLASVYRKLAAAEEQHAAFWEGKLRA